MWSASSCLLVEIKIWIIYIIIFVINLSQVFVFVITLINAFINGFGIKHTDTAVAATMGTRNLWWNFVILTMHIIQYIYIYLIYFVFDCLKALRTQVSLHSNFRWIGLLCNVPFWCTCVIFQTSLVGDYIFIRPQFDYCLPLLFSVVILEEGLLDYSIAILLILWWSWTGVFARTLSPAHQSVFWDNIFLKTEKWDGNESDLKMKEWVWI